MFEIAATATFAAAAVIWRTNDWLNVAIKVAMVGLAAWGCFEALTANGYIVKNI